MKYIHNSLGKTPSVLVTDVSDMIHSYTCLTMRCSYVQWCQCSLTKFSEKACGPHYDSQSFVWHSWYIWSINISAYWLYSYIKCHPKWWFKADFNEYCTYKLQVLSDKMEIWMTRRQLTNIPIPNVAKLVFRMHAYITHLTLTSDFFLWESNVYGVASLSLMPWWKSTLLEKASQTQSQQSS